MIMSDIIKSITSQDECKTFVNFYEGSRSVASVMRHIYGDDEAKVFIKNGTKFQFIYNRDLIPNNFYGDIIYPTTKKYTFMYDFLEDTLIMMNFMKLNEIKKESKMNSIIQIDYMEDHSLSFTFADGEKTLMPFNEDQYNLINGNNDRLKERELLTPEIKFTQEQVKFIHEYPSDQLLFLDFYKNENNEWHIEFHSQFEDLDVEPDYEITISNKFLPGLLYYSLSKGDHFSDVTVSVVNTEMSEYLKVLQVNIKEKKYNFNYEFVFM